MQRDVRDLIAELRQDAIDCNNGTDYDPKESLSWEAADALEEVYGLGSVSNRVSKT